MRKHRSRKIGDIYQYVDVFYTWSRVNPQTNEDESGYTHAECSLCKDEGKEHTLHFSPLISEAREAAEKLLPHMESVHKLTKCEHCDSYVTTRGKKHHQKGLFCRGAQHRNLLVSQGKKRVSPYKINGISRFFTEMADYLVYGDQTNYGGGWVPKDARTTILTNFEKAKIYNEANLLAAKFLDIIQLTHEPTHFIPGGWGAKRRLSNDTWISSEYDRLLELLPSYSWDHNHTEIVSRYHERPEERDSIICILEMQNEANNSE